MTETLTNDQRAVLFSDFTSKIDTIVSMSKDCNFDNTTEAEELWERLPVIDVSHFLDLPFRDGIMVYTAERNDPHYGRAVFGILTRSLSMYAEAVDKDDDICIMAEAVTAAVLHIYGMYDSTVRVLLDAEQRAQSRNLNVPSLIGLLKHSVLLSQTTGVNVFYESLTKMPTHEVWDKFVPQDFVGDIEKFLEDK